MQGGCQPAAEHDNGSYSVSVEDNKGNIDFQVTKTDRIIPAGSEVDGSWRDLLDDIVYSVHRHNRRLGLNINKIMNLPGAVMKYTDSELEVISFDKNKKQFYLLTQGTSSPR